MKQVVTLKRVGETKNFYIFEDRKTIICNKVYVEKEAFDCVPDQVQFELSAVTGSAKPVVTEIG